MSRRIFESVLAACCVAIAPLAMGQTVTVAPTGADYTSVKAAVDSFNTGGVNFGNAAANIINIAPGTYLEPAPIKLTASGDWTIRATTGTATLVVTSPANEEQGLFSTVDSTAATNLGINGSVTIENITLLPASEPGTGVRATLAKGFIFENATATIASSADILSVTMRNVLVSANNGSNQPASDGTFVAAGDYTALSSNGLRMLSGVNQLDLENVVVTHCGAGVSDNGDIEAAVTTMRRIGPGCSFSYNNGDGWYLSGGDLSSIEGTTSSLVKFTNNNGSGFRFNSSVNDIGDVSYAVFMNNAVTSDTGDASGIHFVGARQTAGSEFYRCLFAFNGSGTGVGFGNISASNSQNSTVTFRECTIFDAANDQPTITQFDQSAGDLNMTFIDCVIAGGGVAGAQDYIRSSENSAVMTFDHCAVVLAGAYSLDTDRATVDPTTGYYYGGTGPGAIVYTAVIHSDPVFLSIDPAVSDFLDVHSAAYATASSTHGPLSGSQDFVPQPNAVGHWTLY